MENATSVYDLQVARNEAYKVEIGPEALALKLSLRRGELIIATEDAYYDYNEEVKAKNILSQRKGQIISVNNPGVSEGLHETQWFTKGVGGHGIYDGPEGTPEGQRSCVGLGCDFKDGKYRRALPTDEGYVATLDFWRAHDRMLAIQEEVHKGNRELMMVMVIIVLVAIILLR